MSDTTNTAKTGPFSRLKASVIDAWSAGDETAAKTAFVKVFGYAAAVGHAALLTLGISNAVDAASLVELGQAVMTMAPGFLSTAVYAGVGLKGTAEAPTALPVEDLASRGKKYVVAREDFEEGLRIALKQNGAQLTEDSYAMVRDYCAGFMDIQDKPREEIIEDLGVADALSLQNLKNKPREALKAAGKFLSNELHPRTLLEDPIKPLANLGTGIFAMYTMGGQYIFGPTVIAGLSIQRLNMESPRFKGVKNFLNKFPGGKDALAGAILAGAAIPLGLQAAPALLAGNVTTAAVTQMTAFLSFVGANYAWGKSGGAYRPNVANELRSEELRDAAMAEVVSTLTSADESKGEKTAERMGGSARGLYRPARQALVPRLI